MLDARTRTKHQVMAKVVSACAFPERLRNYVPLARGCDKLCCEWRKEKERMRDESIIRHQEAERTEDDPRSVPERSCELGAEKRLP